MVKVPLVMMPFPPLTWTGFSWIAQVTVPGFHQDGPVDLEIKVPLTRPADMGADHLPSAEQASSYRFLLEDGPGIWAALLTAVRDRIPEWAEWPLNRVGADVQLSRLTVHPITWDGAAYIGYWLGETHPDTWLPEGGTGVTAHRYRVVAVGCGEESRDERAAAADVRRLKKSHRGLPPRRG